MFLRVLLTVLRSGPGSGPSAKAWSVTSLDAPQFMQIRGEPRRKVIPKDSGSGRRSRPQTSGGRVEGSRPRQ